MCIHCYRTEVLTLKKRLNFIGQLPNICYTLIKRKRQRANKKYNHFWVSRTVPGKDGGDVQYYAKNAVKIKYDHSDIAQSKVFAKKEYAEFMAGIFETYQQPKNKITNKMGFINHIEDVSLVKTIMLIPYVIVRIFKAKTIGTLFN